MTNCSGCLQLPETLNREFQIVCSARWEHLPSKNRNSKLPWIIRDNAISFNRVESLVQPQLLDELNVGVCIYIYISVDVINCGMSVPLCMERFVEYRMEE